jgi:hypothetical protein
LEQLIDPSVGGFAVQPFDGGKVFEEFNRGEVWVPKSCGR